ncbi:hypothetical protein SAMN04489809_1245 [Microbacterium paraoxydans]|jgi:hypothetical protein|uniref:Uncharacterized protein n=2 Tax=Microbacteriaceae TaxID=85023 RepID=A0A1H1Q0V8_9MICO|nr:hypothetical protein SAMN04489809_1245 [Microbacterium paraoxydans]
MVLSMAVMLTACGPDTGGIAEERLGNDVGAAVAAMSTAVESTPTGSDPAPEHYAEVSTFELLSGLEELPDARAANTMYCLQRAGDTITACVFFPINVSIPSGLAGYSASVYGCAELSGVPGSFDVQVADVECPSELVDWFSERADEEPSVVSVRASMDP